MTDERQEAEREGHERTWAILCHLGAFSALVIPLGHILVPLVIWLVKKEGSPFVDEHGKESLNFQISMTIYALIATLLVFVLIGFLLLILLAIFDLVMVIMGAVKASNGEKFRYPLCIRFIK